MAVTLVWTDPKGSIVFRKNKNTQKIQVINGESKEVKTVGLNVAKRLVHVQHVRLMVMMAIVVQKHNYITMEIARRRQ